MVGAYKSGGDPFPDHPDLSNRSPQHDRFARIFPLSDHDDGRPELSRSRHCRSFALISVLVGGSSPEVMPSTS